MKKVMYYVFSGLVLLLAGIAYIVSMVVMGFIIIGVLLLDAAGLRKIKMTGEPA